MWTLKAPSKKLINQRVSFKMNGEKLLVLTSGFPKHKDDIKGGGGFVYQLCQELKKKFYVIVLAPFIEGAKKFDEQEGIWVHRYQYFIKLYSNLSGDEGIVPKLRNNYLNFFKVPFLLVFQFFALNKLVKRNEIEKIHAHWIIPQGLIAVIYKKLINKKIGVLLTVHGGDIFGIDNKLGKFLKKFVLNNVDIITVVSNHIKKEVLKYTDKSEIYIQPMGVDTKKFNPSNKSEKLKNELGIESFFLLFVGYISEKKGLEYLIKSMPKIIQKHKQIKLVIIGDGILLNRIKQLAKDLSVDNNIVFLGPKSNSELPKYFATCDIFIGPSIIAKGGDSEGFGIVFAEAASSGAHVVTTDFPAMREIIIDNETGYTVKQKNPDSIAERVLYIIKHSQKNDTIRENARKHVVKNFDWEVVGEKYISLINKLQDDK